MLDADSTHEDLRTGRAPWAIGVRPPRRSIDRDLRCDVVVVGAGITGALAAEHLVSAGLDVCVIDRERPGLGSTAASTAMLLWEIDRSVADLTALYGFDKAAQMYRLSLRAVAGLKELIGSRNVHCVLRERDSLYLAAGTTDARALLSEHELRQRAGLPSRFLDYRRLREKFGIDREAALLSSGAADADPLCLAHDLLRSAIDRGARLFDANAIDYQTGGRRVAVITDDGHLIEADWVVLATGYVMPDFVHSDIHRISASWAIATPAQPERARWHDGVLIWEATESYLYARTTRDHRIILGGCDDDQVIEAEQRARVTPEKTDQLLASLRTLYPSADATADVAWSGVFGTTEDGLPLIGAVPGYPRVLAAYGYGGNGITFGFIASRVVAGIVGGRHKDWYDDFRMDRPRPLPLTDR